MYERVTWFFESPEFNQWSEGDSEILWLSGKPGDGKTVLTFCLRDHLNQYCTFNKPRDIAFSMCRSPPASDSTTETALYQVIRILSTLVVQLLRVNPERRKLVTQQCQLQGLLIPPTTSSLSGLQVSDLWKVLSASIMVLPSQQAIIIVDGVDEIIVEEMRRSFLRNLLSMREEVLAGGVLDCKIFITSRSFNDITQELKSVPNIERDKERQGKPTPGCSCNISDNKN